MRGVALAAIFSLGACSSSGLSGLGGIGAPSGHAANDNGAGSGSGSGSGSGAGAGSGSPATKSSAAAGSTGRLVSGVGNGGEALREITDVVMASNLPQTLDGVVDPLAAVSVGGARLLGSTAQGATQQLGVSVLSPTQSQGELATIGVLSNGQVANVALPVLGAGGMPIGGDLLGVALTDQQVLGGVNNAIGVGLLAPANATGDIASVNLLSGGQIANVQVNGSTNSGDGLVGSLLTPLGNAAAPASNANNGVLAPVTGLVGGVLNAGR